MKHFKGNSGAHFSPTKVALGVALTVGAVGFGVAADASNTTTFYVPSQSMAPTIKAGTHVLASPLSTTATITVGEIIVLKAPAAAQHVCMASGDLIKRVIGLPGDHLSSKGNTIYINGKVLKQTWTHTEPLGTSIKSVTIAAGHYYVMGDNQANSCDSRLWGTVPRSSIVDRVIRVFATKSSTTTSTTPAPKSACQSDGMVIGIAIAAFEAKNPGVTPTETLLIGTNDGGPYLNRWPTRIPSYAYSISSSGVLQIAIPATAKPTAFKGPASCDSLG